MVYDNTKLKQAVTAWLKANCKMGFGLVYSADLLADFEAYLEKTGALKSSPGPAPFGKQLLAAGLTRKRQAGLTYYEGIQLKKPVTRAAPRRRAKTMEEFEEQFARRDEVRRAARSEHIPSEQERLERKNRVLSEMEQETAERIRSAGDE